MDKIDIVSAHVYHVKPEDSVAQIKAIHDRWQKPIWVTEISPTTQMGNCQFSAEEMKTCEPSVEIDLISSSPRGLT